MTIKAKPKKAGTILDMDGVEVVAGDIVHFAYGIPPVGVAAPIVSRNGKLIALTRGHKPAECPLADLNRHAGPFWVEKIKKAKAPE